VNRQIGDAGYEYVVLDDPLPPGHVTRRMRIANFAFKNGPFTLHSSTTQKWIKLEGKNGGKYG